MAEGPWRAKLTRGQIEQRLIGLKCTKLNESLPDAQLWKPPHGPVFTISLEACDSEYLEGMVSQIEEWIKKGAG